MGALGGGAVSYERGSHVGLSRCRVTGPCSFGADAAISERTRHKRPSGPESGPGFQVKQLQTVGGVPFSLDRAMHAVAGASMRVAMMLSSRRYAGDVTCGVRAV